MKTSTSTKLMVRYEHEIIGTIKILELIPEESRNSEVKFVIEKLKKAIDEGEKLWDEEINIPLNKAKENE